MPLLIMTNYCTAELIHNPCNPFQWYQFRYQSLSSQREKNSHILKVVLIWKLTTTNAIFVVYN